MSETGIAIAEVLGELLTSGHGYVDQYDVAAWSALDRHGFVSTNLASEIGLEEFVSMAAVVGETASAVPLVEAGIASWLAHRLQLTLPDGLSVPTVGDSRDHWAINFGQDGDLIVDGTTHRIPWGRHADSVVAVVGCGERQVAFHIGVPTDVVEHSNFAGEPRDRLTWRGRRVPADAWRYVDDVTQNDLRARGALMRVAAMAGAMERVLDLVLVYAKQREQFGKSIGTYQAVQHHLVIVAEAAVATRAALSAAVAADPSQRAMAVGSAKLVASEHAAALARSSHQVFGAIGITQEHILQRYTRRLWSWQDEFGSTVDWADFLGDELVFDNSPGAWPVISGFEARLDTRAVAEALRW